jgi:hypothetical protein
VIKDVIFITLGFIEGLRPRLDTSVKLREITLLTLNKPATYGAVYLGAQKAGVHLPANYTENATIFFHHNLE